MAVKDQEPGENRNGAQISNYILECFVKVGLERRKKRAEKLEIKKLTSQDSDLVDHWKIANNVPVPKRQAWRESEQGRYHFADIETELAILNEKRSTGSETNRLFQVKARPRRGTRKSILNQVAIEYSLTSNQVKYMWDEYMIFERNS